MRLARDSAFAIEWSANLGALWAIAKSPVGEEEFLLALLRDRIPLGVDQAAYVKAGWLTVIAKGELTSPLVSSSYTLIRLVFCFQMITHSFENHCSIRSNRFKICKDTQIVWLETILWEM